jgi:hypothetical protein
VTRFRLSFSLRFQLRRDKTAWQALEEGGRLQFKVNSGLEKAVLYTPQGTPVYAFSYAAAGRVSQSITEFRDKARFLPGRQ